MSKRSVFTRTAMMKRLTVAEYPKEEITHLHVARGLLIALVVMGHIDGAPVLSEWIYLFHVAGLVFLSGYFTKVDTFSIKACFQQCLHRVGRLYFLYLKYELLFLLLKNLFFKIGFYSPDILYGGKWIQADTWLSFIQNLGLILVGMGREVFALTFWYFISLIGIVALFTLSKYLSDKQSLMSSNLCCLLLVVFLFLIGCLLSALDIRIPRVAQSFTLILPFYWGYMQRNSKYKLRFDGFWWMLLSAIGLYVLHFYGGISMNINRIENPLFFVAASFMGIYLVISLSKYIEKYLPPLCALFRYWGIHSAGIMIFHALSFKSVSLAAYWMGCIDYSAIAQLKAPGSTFYWYIASLLAGIYLSVFLYKWTEKAWKLLLKRKK